MPSATPSPGASIRARCPRCRKNTSHKILSLEQGTPVDVTCGLCHDQHKYRPPTPQRKPASKGTGTSNAAAREEWAALRPDMNVSKAIDYSMDTAYKRGSLINHATFGLGLVQRVLGDRKIEVLFESGRKMMRCQQI